jgi:hypothetical protein
MFIVLSNLSFLLCIFVLIYKKKFYYSFEICDFLAIIIVSSFYHYCDSSYKTCITSYQALHFMDHFFSPLLITSAVTPHLPTEVRHGFRILMFPITLLLVLVYEDSVSTLIILAGLNTYIFILCRDETSDNLICYLFAAIFLIGALYVKIQGGISEDQTGQTYIVYHSLWHVFIALSISSFYLALPVLSTS